MAVAAMVFAELSMKEFLQKYGTVTEYYESFNYAFINEGLKERYLVDYFWQGLPSQITYEHGFFPPKTISDAYRLAKSEEKIYRLIHGITNPDLCEIKNNRRGSFDLGYGVSEKEELVANGGNNQESALTRSTVIESEWDSMVSALETLKEGVNKLARDLASGNNRVDGNGKESEYAGLKSLNECCEEQVESGEKDDGIEILVGANGFAKNKNSERCKEDVEVDANNELEPNESSKMDVDGVVKCEEDGKDHESESSRVVDNNFGSKDVVEIKIGASISVVTGVAFGNTSSKEECPADLVTSLQETEVGVSTFMLTDESGTKADISIVGIDSVESKSGQNEEIELFGYCSLDMGKSFEVDKKMHWKAKTPWIGFIGEIDVVGRQRGTGLGWENDEREQTLHQLLTELAGFSGKRVMSESEVVLAEQVDKVSSDAEGSKDKIRFTRRQGDLIRKFLKKSANKLIIYGLYMADLVWEKLDKVNGNTVYMTDSFREFNAEIHETRSWDEQNAFANTAEYNWKCPRRKKASNHVNFKFKRRLWNFHMWEWHKRMRIGGTECKSEHRKWNFDMWNWPLREKDELESYIYIQWHYYSREMICKPIEMNQCIRGAKKMDFTRLHGSDRKYDVGDEVNDSSATMGEFPQCDGEGLIAASPVKHLERKMVKQNNRVVGRFGRSGPTFSRI
ncbi:hypothetical protein CTI12_AA436650 [Artemisia annua]|uniref:Uncharacterized protein n=1 Tax=Artemisia annua TaxID=35608 RepID=A0A2U1M1E7_ARTAN|nr:hypothetical protein CTI12_AA436650 [Artemisia annua]